MTGFHVPAGEVTVALSVLKKSLSLNKTNNNYDGKFGLQWPLIALKPHLHVRTTELWISF